MPISSLETLVEGGALLQVETSEYRWKWLYAANTALPDDTSEFSAWHETALYEIPTQATAIHNASKLGIITEILDFNLGTQTPLQAMNAIVKWQEALRS